VVFTVVIVGALVVPLVFGKRKGAPERAGPARETVAQSTPAEVPVTQAPPVDGAPPAEQAVRARVEDQAVRRARPGATPPGSGTSVVPPVALNDDTPAPAAHAPRPAVAPRTPVTRPATSLPTRPGRRLVEAEPAGEKVDVLWGSRWFPATVLERKDGKAFIKYDGWNEHFNEWVPPDRVRARAASAE
jgi:hypothetical protein